MPMYKKQIGVLIIVLLAAIGGTYYGIYQEEKTVVLDSGSSNESAATVQEITIYVTGAVNQPGLVKVKEGARAAEAVNACGGLLPIADSEKVNMAQVLKDGQQLMVPEKRGGMGENKMPSKDNAGSEKVNINTADEKALDTLPGIGPAMAKRIIEYRQTEGPFQSVEDLKKIRGIGEAKFAKMKEKICI